MHTQIIRVLLLSTLLALAACAADPPARPVHTSAQQKPAAPASQPDTPPPAPQAAAPATHSIATQTPPAHTPKPQTESRLQQQKSVAAPAAATTRAPQAAKPGEFEDVAALDPGIRLDIRYATTHNFTKAQIYDCPRCLLRPAAAAAIVQAHRILQKKGLGLKMFDCYRPRPYQQRLWDKVPNPDYVTPPAKGSMHSRGAAVDLTIVDKNGKELDMGTEYDFFGKEAHTDYTGHPAQVQANRDLLRKTLEQAGFKGIRTEWWHFSFQGHDFPLSSYVWPCK